VKHEVVVSHGSDQHTHSLEYDDVVFALGSVTNFYDIPNLAETAVAMKSLGDAIRLRNLLIERLEEADAECAANDRISLLHRLAVDSGPEWYAVRTARMLPRARLNAFGVFDSGF
jgi:NADH dehydrogenase